MSDRESPSVPETPATPPVTSFEEFARKATLGPARTLGEKTAKFHQQQELLKRKSAVSALQDIVVIGKVAREVGLTAIPMTALQLRGALALVVQQARSEEGLSKCAAAGQGWIDARRPSRERGKFTVFVSATAVGPELAEAGKQLQLRRVSAPKGLRGKLGLADATDLGQRFSATVQLFDGDNEYIVVRQGEVDRDLITLLEAELGASPGTRDTVEDASEVKATVLHTAEEQAAESAETEDEGSEVQTDTNVAPPPSRHPIRPTLPRRSGSAA
jgi:hypothetical protein